jgi:hypothetical protein|tara:strand:- start:1185 stop:1667 length:483 start_codon:yes stop_codon:yes gene_type:complete
MERVIDCPVCYDTDRCFEDVQENYSSYLCFKCGFMSDSRYEIGGLQLMDNLKKSPRLVQELQFEDKDRNIVWFPAVINMGEKGIIFPDVPDEKKTDEASFDARTENYVWKYAAVVDVPQEEQSNYDNHTKRLDVENAKEFSKYEFMEACKEMGITRDISG